MTIKVSSKDNFVYRVGIHINLHPIKIQGRVSSTLSSYDQAPSSCVHYRSSISEARTWSHWAARSEAIVRISSIEIDSTVSDAGSWLLLYEYLDWILTMPTGNPFGSSQRYPVHVLNVDSVGSTVGLSIGDSGKSGCCVSYWWLKIGGSVPSNLSSLFISDTSRSEIASDLASSLDHVARQLSTKDGQPYLVVNHH